MSDHVAASSIDWRPNTAHWGVVTKTLHWAMALMIIGMLIVGFLMTNMEPSLTVYELYQMHKSFGFTVGALALARIVWRLTCERTPPLPSGTPLWQRIGAHVSHYGLYALMVAMPITGWVMVSASTLGIPTSYFGLFTIPDIVADNAELEATMKTAHEMMAFAMIGLIGMHVAAAFKHAVFNRDGVFGRMLPGR